MGNLLNYPEILRNNKYPLRPEDFKPNLLHEYLFRTIRSLASKGLESIDELVVGEYIESYPIIKEVIDDNDGLEFIHTIKELNKENTIEVHYPVVKKYSMIRELRGEHQDKENQELFSVDFTRLCDSAWDSEKQLKALSDYSIDDMIGMLESKLIQTKKDYTNQDIREESWVGVGFKDILEQFKTEPVMGAGLVSAYETTIFRGFQRGHLLLYSAKSGGGKSTRAVANLCYVCSKKLWSEKENKYVDNPNYQGKGFFIHTEMQQKTELQSKFIANISNIPYDVILDGKYTEEMEQRLIEAAEILEDSGIKLVYMPLFTIPLLKEAIRELSVVDKCIYGVFDYIQNNGVAGKVYKHETGTALREDMLLLAITTELKLCAEEYGVGIISMTQLNGKEDEATIIDEHCLAGAKSMKNKLDGGIIMLPPKEKELKNTAILYDKKGFGQSNKVINLVSHVYKGRFSKYGQNLKIFQIMDYGTGRIEDCYVTDQYNEQIAVDKTIVEKIE